MKLENVFVFEPNGAVSVSESALDSRTTRRQFGREVVKQKIQVITPRLNIFTARLLS